MNSTIVTTIGNTKSQVQSPHSNLSESCTILEVHHWMIVLIVFVTTTQSHLEQSQLNYKRMFSFSSFRYYWWRDCA